MPAVSSLTQLLAHHRRILLLDAVSMRVSVGLLQTGRPAIWHTEETEAGRAVFSGTSATLAQAGLAIDDIEAFLFCEGPGSMLGTRTVAMALRTWQTLKPRPAYAYQSLAVVARAEWKQQPRSFSVLADARRESWHVQSISAQGTLAPLNRCATAELPASEFLTPAHFRAWSVAPPSVVECAYDLSAITERLADDHLFSQTETPDAFQVESPDYKKWSAQTHSAETAVRKS